MAGDVFNFHFQSYINVFWKGKFNINYWILGMDLINPSRLFGCLQMGFLSEFLHNQPSYFTKIN